MEPEIFPTFQHKVERVPHFARVSEVRHIFTHVFRSGGYKGYGLAVMVEMMTSVLGGAHVGPEHRHWADTSRPSNTVSRLFLFQNMVILDGVV